MEINKDNIDLFLIGGGILLVLAQAVFFILKRMHPPIVQIKPDSDMHKMVEDLHEWHNQRDSEGRFLWWENKADKENSKAMFKALIDLGNTQRQLVHTLRSMAQTQDNSTFLIKECLSEIKANRK